MPTKLIVDSFTFSHASPETSVLFVGPSLFPKGTLSESVNREIVKQVKVALALENKKVTTEYTNLIAELRSGVEEYEELNKKDITSDEYEYYINPFKLFAMTQNVSLNSNLPLLKLIGLGSSGKAYLSSPQNAVTKLSISNVMYTQGNLLMSVFKNRVYEDFLYGTESYNAVDRKIEVGDQIKIDNNYLYDTISNIVSLPVGIGILYLDRKNEVANAVYLEGCRVEGFGSILNSSNPAVQDSLNLEVRKPYTLKEEEARSLLNSLIYS